MSTDVAQAARLIERWQREPLTWLRDVLGGPQPWSRQAEIIEAIPRYAEVDVASGHSIGKDWLSARIALWWLFTRPNSIVITTAPTERQVKTILWGELRKAYRQSRVPLGGLLADVDSMLRVGPMHYAKGIVSRDASSLQGFHAEHVLLIVDEAAGIASYAFEGLESCASTATSRILRIGNPTSGPNHPFARSCRRPTEEGKHLTIEISSTETPNYKAGKELIPGLASREFVDRIAERYGEHSQTYRSRVLGKFPTGSPDSLITLDHIGEARSRFNDDLPNAESQEVRVGVDVARQGPDATSICVRRGKGSKGAKASLVVILETLSGTCTTGEAAERLKVSLSRYYQLETRALQGMLSALEPRPRGRRKTKDDEIRALKAEKKEVERELRRATSLLRAATRSVGVKAAKKGARSKRAARRARGATVMETIRKETADGPQEQGGAAASPDPGE